MHIPSQTDMVDDQHLKEYKHNETDDLERGFIHFV